ncbi:MAG: ABC transporter permease [Erysipelotrichaceae bacterium]|jgi:cell division transport system permease protein|nr:ABC transporter permease [Erysipelotrichaceae bacterium]
MINRPLKEGFSGVGRHWAMSISSAIAVTITLVIISIFLLLTWNVNNFTQNIESSLDIYASVDYNSENQEASLKKEIEAIDGVESVTLSPKSAEFDAYLDSFTDEKTKEAFEPFRSDNPMHDAFYVKAADGSKIQSIADELSQMKSDGKGIYQVNYGGQSTISIVDAMAKIRQVGLVLVVGLMLLAIFLIQNTIKLTITARATEIEIMRNVGASNRFIRSPFLIEGIIIGILGAILPIAATIWGYLVLYDRAGGILLSNMFHLVEPFPFVYYISGILLLMGIVVGFVGSWLSVTRYLRWKR